MKEPEYSSPDMLTREKTEQFDDTLALIKDARRIIIVTHQRPDGDAIGSALALSHYLDDVQILHDLFCVHEAPEEFSYLKHAKRITTDPKLIIEGDHDVLICLDAGDLLYAGIADHLSQREKRHTIINIDHHTTNANYGHVNVVDPEASSTAEIVYHLVNHAGHPISQEMATCLLTGIMSDTGGFSNMATTSSSLHVASQLLALGARIWDIQAHTQKNKPIQTLKLWGTALSRLVKHESGIVTTILTLKDFRDNNVDPKSAEGIINFLNTLDDAKAIILIREDGDGKIKVSLRTTQPDIDVSRVAKAFGGGGHKKAAGFSFPGKIVAAGEGWQIE
jgi:phosphoesterase RecJ-like protein